MLNIYTSFKMTSDYGERMLPNGDDNFHYGIDIVGLNSKTILSPVDGVVKSSTIILNKSNLTWQWGNYIRIDSIDGYKHYFCHLSKRLVKVGDKIKKGDVIGIEGKTGYSFGSHLHYGIRNFFNKWVNPQTYWHLRLIENIFYNSTKYKYTETKNKTRQLYVPVRNVYMGVYPNLICCNKVPYENFINGTFFGGNPVYSTSILVVDGKIYRGRSNYFDLDKPQDTFIIYKDNTVGMKRIKSTLELDMSKVKHAIGGIGLLNKFDKQFKYNPKACGFPCGVTRKCNKTVLGYIKESNEIVFMTRPNIAHKNWYGFDLIKLVKACGYDIAIALDGSGSTCMKANNQYKLEGDGRGIYSVIYAE